ncbi:MAG TPA: acyl-CoA dehydrogenase family protein [Burkholderiales bacterium]|nr:acyl-CoA dehydrogenase family protein [Burkholderiales bacterium]
MMSPTSIEQAVQPDDLSSIVLDQAERLFRGEVTKERLAAADRGEWPAAIWTAVEQAGLPLALVPEARGGVGLPAADALRLIRLSGYHTLPVPLAETMIANALWAEASGAPVEGPVSLAPVAPAQTIGMEHAGGGCTLSGELRRVPWASQVDRLLLHACDRAGTAWLALLPRPISVVESRKNLAYEPRDTIVLDGTVLPQEVVVAAPERCRDGLLAFGALARAQQMVGAMERCLDYALAYAMERRQFGRPIGKFQAVQQMLADAAGQYAAAAAGADLAAQAYGTADFDFAVAVAKARVGEAAGKVAEICHQTHGAMGFTQEHPLHFATRRLWSWRDEFGNETFWQERIGRLVCSRGGEALWTTLVGA